MPGGQPRRGVYSRLGSSVARRAYVPAGVPGVYGLGRRRRRRPDQEPIPLPVEWIQGPDYTVVLPFTVSTGWSVIRSFADKDATPDADVAQDLRDGIFDADPLGSDPPTEAVQMLVQTLFHPDGSGYTQVQTSLGSFGAPTEIGLAGGLSLDYVAPTPPPGGSVEYEAADGLAVGDVTLAGGLGVGGESYSVGGSLWWSPESGSTYRTTQHVVETYNLLASYVDQPDTTVSLTVPAVTLFGASVVEQGSAEVWVHATSDAIALPGTSGRAAGSEDIEESQIIFGGPTATITVRPPRHRLVAAVVENGWTANAEWNGYVWDAGLYLSSSFADLTGFPASLPSGCAQLNFVVDSGAGEFELGFLTPPYAQFWVDSGGNDGVTSGVGDAPDAGAHLWVLWYGPAFNIGSDPFPSPSPESLVPASLAENGIA